MPPAREGMAAMAAMGPKAEAGAARAAKGPPAAETVDKMARRGE